MIQKSFSGGEIIVNLVPVWPAILFVHLLSGTHVITDSKGPNAIFASGQLCYWKDGRNVPDIMTGIMQYPETPEHSPFQLTLQVNFVSGTGGSEVIRFVGDEGTIDINGGEGLRCIIA